MYYYDLLHDKAAKVTQVHMQSMQC